VLTNFSNGNHNKKVKGCIFILTSELRRTCVVAGRKPNLVQLEIVSAVEVPGQHFAEETNSLRLVPPKLNQLGQIALDIFEAI
jgi:hypothetical protein